MARLVTADFSNSAEPCVLRYTTVDNKMLSFMTNSFSSKISSHIFEENEWKVVFERPIDRIGGFRSFNKLASISIPNSVTKISDYAFCGCENLKTANIPNGIQYIGKYAFSGCHCLKDIKLPDSVTYIGHMAFFACTSLESIAISDKTLLKNIAYDAFKGCYESASVYIYIADERTYYGSNGVHIIPGSKHLIVKDFGSSIGETTKEITELFIPDGVIALNVFSFKNCVGLTSIIIPNSVEKISAYAFENCRNLETIDVGCNVSNVDVSAFVNCPNITRIKCNSITPPSLTYLGNGYIDRVINKLSRNVTIIVPQGCKKTYVDRDWGRVFGVDNIIDIEIYYNMIRDEINNISYNSQHHSHHGDYRGTYAQDIADYSDDEIDDIFEGEPDAYWNID